ncbi:ankyrin repeat-containing domain protein [Aspergillus egyptiacus]|nr:ankyrin repeat-containing domain protein [Aspergillus egyptiacus]
MADDSCDAHRAEIERLYIQENKTLKYIAEFMARKGFRKTKSQYETLFKKWGLRKKQTVPRNANWDFIAKRVEKRKRLQGKESEVVIDEETISPEKVRKLQYGKIFVSTADRFSGYGAPSPQTPEGVIVRTPPSSIDGLADQAWCGGLSLTWSPCLPWLRFTKLLHCTQNQGKIPPQAGCHQTAYIMCWRNTDRPALSPVLPIPFSSEVSVQSDLEKNELMQRLEYAFPSESRSQLLHVDVDSRIRAMLTALMPEESEGQHRRTQTTRLSIELYMLSNNLESYDGLRSSEAHEPLLAMIRSLGWHKGRQFKTLLASQEPTVEAIVEKIFASAVFQEDIEVMKVILEAGMDPNFPVEDKVGTLITPLLWAAAITNSRGAEMAELLVSHKADIKPGHGRDSALWEAILRSNVGVIQVLLRHNVVVDLWCLRKATTAVGANLFEELLASCPDINRVTYDGLQEDGVSPLFPAIATNKVDIIEVLLRHNFVVSLECLGAATRAVSDTNLFEKLLTSCPDVNGLIAIETHTENVLGFAVVTLLGAAARSGRLEIIKTILRVCPNLVNPRELEATGGARYLSPISAAIEHNRTDALKALLVAGVDTNFVNRHEKPPIQQALERNHLRAYEILVESGVTLTQPLSYNSLRVLMRFISGKEDCVSTMKQLLDESAQLSRNVTEWSGEVLAEAIDNNDLLVIGLLLDFGATTNINKLSYTWKQPAGYLDTAQYLDTRGALQAILDEVGPKFLSTALECRKWDLAQWLVIREPGLLDEGLYSGSTPLCIAVLSKQLELVRLMLRHGARVTDGALLVAIHWIRYDSTRSGLRPDERFEVLGVLLSNFNGPAPSAIAEAGRGPMDFEGTDDGTDQGIGDCTNFESTDQGMDQDIYLLELLLSQGVEPTGIPEKVFLEEWDGPYKPQSALEIVAASGNRLALDILTQTPYNWGAKILGRALAVACGLPNEDLIDPILKREPNMNEEVEFRRSRPHPPNREGLGAGFHSTGLQGFVTSSTALQVAVRSQNTSIVRKLLAFGDTDVNYPAKGHFGRTALQHAVENGNLKLISMLLNHNADVNSPPAENGGATALQLAAIQGYLGIAHRLLDLGADVNAPGATVEGRTALAGAAEHGRIDMIHMLLEEGASILGAAGERQYEKAVQLAKGNGHHALARMLGAFKSKVELILFQIADFSIDGGGEIHGEEEDEA